MRTKNGFQLVIRRTVIDTAKRTTVSSKHLFRAGFVESARRRLTVAEMRQTSKEKSMQAETRENEEIKQPWSEIHPLSREDSAAMTALRSAVAAMKGKLEGVAARAAFNGIMERVAAPNGVTFEADTFGGTSGWWAKPARARTGAALLHLHGGWFNWGAAQAFRNFVGHSMSPIIFGRSPIFPVQRVSHLPWRSFTVARSDRARYVRYRPLQPRRRRAAWRTRERHRVPLDFPSNRT
jgi:hypothetical protein